MQIINKQAILCDLIPKEKNKAGHLDAERVEQGPFREGTLGVFREQEESQRGQDRVRRKNGKT